MENQDLQKFDEKHKTGRSNTMEQQVKSRAVVKYSAVQAPANFARLQCNTDLNLPPSNWLTSSAESYGLQHVLCKSTGFSSFRMAHMFPDCLADVDVVSDAENIKKLLKIPYSRDAVSMVVHRIEKTLLIDEFDFHKHLLRTSETDWEWLRKFFFEQVLQTLSEKDVGMSIKDKSRHVLQQRALVSKFLHYSLAEPKDKDNEPVTADEPSVSNNQQDFLANKWPPLPDPRPEEKLPDPTTDHTFNRNVVWTFEDIQMLLGTDLPIFGGSTHPCISLRLRDMTKPINVLTGIDYWLDNLMCNVPEVVMCYHLDGIVQRYELVKTEDLPQLPDSKFSPNLIRDVAQNILSFLKSNATKAGHTYWLFKGKDEDIVKLYDLTSLCSENLVEKGQNPFTVPVGMLLYRVARNMKHSADPASMRPGTIRALLNNCLSLLPKEKYPQIVTSAHYMLSDLYLPLGVDPQFLKDETSSPEPPAEDEEDPSPIKSLCISPDFHPPPPLPPYVPPPPLVGSVQERCQQALHHVVAGLQCLPYFEIAPQPQPKSDHGERNSDETSSNDQHEPKMAQSHQPIPMPYTCLASDQPKTSKNGPVTNTLPKKKNKKKKNESNQIEKEKQKKDKPLTPEVNEDQENHVLDQFPVYFWNSDRNALLKKPQAMALPTWHSPETVDDLSWKGHLKTLLYEKACLVYNTLAEVEYSAKRYGKSLLYVKMVLRCHTHMARGCGRCNSLVSGMLGRGGDNCFHITRDWNNLETHKKDYQQLSPTDKAIAQEMAADIPSDEYPNECVIIPEEFESVEQMLLSSWSCYHQALKLKPSDALHARSGNVLNELHTIYLNKIIAVEVDKRDDPLVRSQIETWFNLAQQYLDLGQEEFAKIGDKYNLALLLSNSGKLMRMQALYKCSPDKPGLQPDERAFYDKALSLYQKGLGVLGSRKSGPQVWDVITWDTVQHSLHHGHSLHPYDMCYVVGSQFVSQGARSAGQSQVRSPGVGCYHMGHCPTLSTPWPLSASI
ncbi:erythroid differentiation-related factor 1 isoform X2 [Macrosteles quadrilineatus]|uniref:erythroid differentiation-related factor 1 isoform X2 n=1 Tax=Macrosteles quadrilineatus TaxID=74068 RepID=UPI0023E2FBEB|nr:erythroid differentiation-related factor 1 isoform X2 [Macrosteles quadrilineatus]